MAGSIVVTGISGRLGRLLARQLHRQHPIIGIDRRPFELAPADVKMHRIDIRSRRCEDVFRTNDVEAVIHLNVMHDPRKDSEEAHTFNVMGTQQLLEYCVKYDVPKLIFLSTANHYGTGPRTQRYLKEDAPLMGAALDHNQRALVELDMLCTTFFWQHPEVETVVLRPVHILGPVRNAASNYLRLPRVPKLMGFDPMIQGIHVDDIVAALIKALTPGARGVYNVTGPDPVPLSAILDRLNKPILPVPHPLFKFTVKQMFKAHLWSFPPAELEHLMYGCMIDGSRIREELGLKPTRSMTDIVELFRS